MNEDLPRLLAVESETDPLALALGLRQAVVQSISGNTATLRIGADTVDVPGVRTFVPVIPGQTVWIFADGAQVILLDAIDTGWADLSLVNGWTNYNLGWATAQYRRVGGIVHVKGLVKSGTTTSGTTIATLPAGFRPASSQGLHKAAVSADAVTFFRVGDNGGITCGVGVSATWLDISCCFVVGA